MGSDVVTVRFDEKTRKRISKLSRRKLETQSEIMRKAVLNYLEREDEANEIKEIVSLKYAQGKVSFEEMVRILGYEEARKTAYFVEVAEKSLKEGI